MAEDTRPRIRGINPPPEKLEEAERWKSEHQNVNASEYLLMVFAAVIGIIVAFTGSFLGLVLVAIPIGFAYLWISGKRKQFEQLSPVTNLPIPLHVYNREFTAPLADNSVVRTNIFFTLPVSLARLDAQLDTVTEKEFLIFVATKTTPPSAQEIENHLCSRLVTFQDENQIPVLRVEVSLHIHIPSQKPKGGGSVSV